MEKLYALLGPDNRAKNFIKWDGKEAFTQPGERLVLIPENAAYGHGWEWDGEKFIDPTPPPAPVVPEKITPVQLRLTLSIYGLLPIVEQKVAELSEVERIYFEYATEIRRANPILNQMAAEMKLTPEQVDEMFIFAAGL